MYLICLEALILIFISIFLCSCSVTRYHEKVLRSVPNRTYSIQNIDIEGHGKVIDFRIIFDDDGRCALKLKMENKEGKPMYFEHTSKISFYYRTIFFPDKNEVLPNFARGIFFFSRGEFYHNDFSKLVLKPE